MKNIIVLVVVISMTLSAQTNKPKNKRPQPDATTKAIEALTAELTSLRAENEKLKEENKSLLEEKQNLIIVNANNEETKTNALKAMVAAYNEIRSDYQKHLQEDINTAQKMRAALSSPPAQQRGYFSNILQSMSDAAMAEAARPVVHCDATTFGNQTTMDCR